MSDFTQRLLPYSSCTPMPSRLFTGSVHVRYGMPDELFGHGFDTEPMWLSILSSEQRFCKSRLAIKY